MMEQNGDEMSSNLQVELSKVVGALKFKIKYEKRNQ
jgi:hypothetical protein